MYKISPFTPLFFKPSTDIGLSSRYMQSFSPYDHILLQIIAYNESNSPSVYIVDVIDGKRRMVNMRSWLMNPNETLYFTEITGLNDGLLTNVQYYIIDL